MVLYAKKDLSSIQQTCVQENPVKGNNSATSKLHSQAHKNQIKLSRTQNYGGEIWSKVELMPSLSGLKGNVHKANLKMYSFTLS